MLNYFTTLGTTTSPGPARRSPTGGQPDRGQLLPGNGPRGAWNDASFAGRSKIVDAINTMDADIVSLEEIENSGKVDGETGTRRSSARRRPQR